MNERDEDAIPIDKIERAERILRRAFGDHIRLVTPRDPDHPVHWKKPPDDAA